MCDGAAWFVGLQLGGPETERADALSVFSSENWVKTRPSGNVTPRAPFISSSQQHYPGPYYLTRGVLLMCLWWSVPGTPHNPFGINFSTSIYETIGLVTDLKWSRIRRNHPPTGSKTVSSSLHTQISLLQKNEVSLSSCLCLGLELETGDLLPPLRNIDTNFSQSWSLHPLLLLLSPWSGERHPNEYKTW